MDLQTYAGTDRALADRVERRIRQKTGNLIRELKIDFLPGEIILSGRTATYYSKQLASCAAKEECGHELLLNLVNDIEVY